MLSKPRALSAEPSSYLVGGAVDLVDRARMPHEEVPRLGLEFQRLVLEQVVLLQIHEDGRVLDLDPGCGTL